MNRRQVLSSQTARMLDRIPMLSGSVAMTLYDVPVIIRSQVHGTAACYSYGGCRCRDCRRANATRIREWKRGSHD